MRRYSIPVKFIALCLAAVCLLLAVGSGLGILFLTVEDLYEKPFDDYFSDAKHSTRQEFAVQLIHRYVSLNLGNLPFTQELKEFHAEKIAQRAAAENRKASFQMVIDDVYAIGKGRLVGRPRT